MVGSQRNRNRLTKSSQRSVGVWIHRLQYLQCVSQKSSNQLCHSFNKSDFKFMVNVGATIRVYLIFKCGSLLSMSFSSLYYLNFFLIQQWDYMEIKQTFALNNTISIREELRNDFTEILFQQKMTCPVCFISNPYLISRIDRWEDDVVVAVWWCHAGTFEGLCACFVVVLLLLSGPSPQWLSHSVSCVLRDASFLTATRFVIGGSREQRRGFALRLCTRRDGVETGGLVGRPVDEPLVVRFHNGHRPPYHHCDLISTIPSKIKIDNILPHLNHNCLGMSDGLTRSYKPDGMGQVHTLPVFHRLAV